MRLRRQGQPQSWRGPAALGLFLSVLYLATADYGARSADPAAAELAAWHLGVHGSPWLDHMNADNPWLVPGAHGHTVSNRFPGAVLIGAPFYAVLGHASGDGYPPAPGAVAAALSTALAMVVLYLALRRTFPQAALGATLALALATPTWAVSAGALWTHGPAQLCFAFALWQLARQRSPAVPLALAVLVRPHLLIVALVMSAWNARRGAPKEAIRVLAYGGVGLLAFLVWNRWIYGYWTLNGHYLARGLHSDGVFGGLGGLPLALLSPQRGLFVLTPVLVVLCLRLPTAWKAEPGWSRAAATGGLLSFLFNVWLVRASGGDSFYGYRLPLESLVLATPLLTNCWMQWWAGGPKHRWAASGLLVASSALSAVGAVLYAPASQPADPWSTLDALALADRHGMGPVVLVMSIAAIATAALLVPYLRQPAQTAPVDKPSRTASRLPME